MASASLIFSANETDSVSTERKSPPTFAKTARAHTRSVTPPEQVWPDPGWSRQPLPTPLKVMSEKCRTHGNTKLPTCVSIGISRKGKMSAASLGRIRLNGLIPSELHEIPVRADHAEAFKGREVPHQSIRELPPATVKAETPFFSGPPALEPLVPVGRPAQLCRFLALVHGSPNQRDLKLLGGK